MCGGNLKTRFPQHGASAAETSLYYVEGKWGANRPHFLPPRNKTATPPTADDKSKIENHMTSIIARLPYPPSVNHYWKLSVMKSRTGKRHVPVVRVGEDGLRYAASVRTVLDGVQTLSGPLAVRIVANPPDRRTRDVDNVLKCLLDSLTKAGIWQDDSQIELLVVQRGELQPGGSIEMCVDEIKADHPAS
jgi:crossover junction endodeoxyribonuclease RusA